MKSQKCNNVYKCGRVMLSRTSVYFAISKLTLLFSYSFYVPCIILSNVYFDIVRAIFPFFILIDHNRKQVLLIKWLIFFFEAQKYLFAFLNFLKMVIFTTLFWRWSTLWNCEMTTYSIRYKAHSTNEDKYDK